MDDYQRTGERMEEITIKFGKGLVGEPFTAKDGKEYVEIKIPNTDPEDKSPWASFVLPARAVHDNQYGKGVWAKIPAAGETRIRKRVRTGTDDSGRVIWENSDRRIPNSELKEMVEAYKNRPREGETRSEGGFNAGAYSEEDPYHAADGSIPPWEDGYRMPDLSPAYQKEVSHESVKEGKEKKKTKAAQER